MSSPGFSLRLATAADAAEVLTIYNQAVTETTATLDLVPRTVEEQRAWITERSGAYCVVVAVAHDDPAVDEAESFLTGTSDRVAIPNVAPAAALRVGPPEQIIGFASLSRYKPRAAYNTTVEDSIYVAAGWTGKGVGRALLTDIVERARSTGFHTVIARIEASSEASRGLHAACGFELVGIEREVGRKFGRWLDVAVMQQVLAKANDSPPPE